MELERAVVITPVLPDYRGHNLFLKEVAGDILPLTVGFIDGDVALRVQVLEMQLSEVVGVLGCPGWYPRMEFVGGHSPDSHQLVHIVRQGSAMNGPAVCSGILCNGVDVGEIERAKLQ